LTFEHYLPLLLLVIHMIPYLAQRQQQLHVYIVAYFAFSLIVCVTMLIVGVSIRAQISVVALVYGVPVIAWLLTIVYCRLFDHESYLVEYVDRFSEIFQGASTTTFMRSFFRSRNNHS
jgi:fatty-acid desaturase